MFIVDELNCDNFIDTHDIQIGILQAAVRYCAFQDLNAFIQISNDVNGIERLHGS